jgi:hypothetical protein
LSTTSAEDVGVVTASKDTNDGDIRNELFNEIPEYEQLKTFNRIQITEADDDRTSPEHKVACEKLKACLKLRAKYIDAHPPNPQDREMKFDDIKV